MGATFEEALAQATAPGELFETQLRELGGVEYRAFVHAPKTLLDVFAMARGSEKPFLVYEDETWTFTEVLDEAGARYGA